MQGGWWILGFVFPQTNDTPLHTLQWFGWCVEKMLTECRFRDKNQRLQLSACLHPNCSVPLTCRALGSNKRSTKKSMHNNLLLLAMLGKLKWRIAYVWYFDVSLSFLHQTFTTMMRDQLKNVTRPLPNPVRGEHIVRFHPLDRNSQPVRCVGVLFWAGFQSL